jgi:hypothetical protein
LDLDGFRKIDGFAWEEGLRVWYSRCSKFGEEPRNIYHWCKKGLHGSKLFKEKDWGSSKGAEGGMGAAYGIY